MSISYGFAFIAGLASFLSPCVFPLVPAYIGYLSGRAVLHKDGEVFVVKKWITITHGISFILGFSVVFVLLGLAFSLLGGWLYSIRDLLAKLGGVIVILFGIHMIGLYRFRFLEYDQRFQTPGSKRVGFLSSFLMGVFFSAGWSPCIGPVLASILTLAMNTGDARQGAILLGFYSLGMGLPFLAAAVGVSWVSQVLVKFRRVIRATEIVMGAILIVVGLMLLTGTFALIAQYGNLIDVGL
ncbi:MAG: cytochrome C biogenesis protein [Anaerolinea sp.]|nr:cytochrome C biogenesis protein [Anaerolinea sp.]